MTIDRGRDFADLVYTVLIVEKKWPLKEVADRMEMQYATLHARLHQRVMFSPEEIRALIHAAPDVRFIAYFLDDSRFVAVDRTVLQGDSLAETVHLGATRTVIEATDVLRVVEKSLQDGHIDHRERLRIQKEIADAERALAALRHRLDGD